MRKQDDRPALTQREQEILRLIAAGKSLPEIFAWVYLRPTAERFALAATGVDIAAISVLAVLSGGPSRTLGSRSFSFQSPSPSASAPRSPPPPQS